MKIIALPHLALGLLAWRRFACFGDVSVTAALDRDPTALVPLRIKLAQDTSGEPKSQTRHHVAIWARGNIDENDAKSPNSATDDSKSGWQQLGRFIISGDNLFEAGRTNSSKHVAERIAEILKNNNVKSVTFSVVKHGTRAFESSPQVIATREVAKGVVEGQYALVMHNAGYSLPYALSIFNNREKVEKRRNALVRIYRHIQLYRLGQAPTVQWTSDEQIVKLFLPSRNVPLPVDTLDEELPVPLTEPPQKPGRLVPTSVYILVLLILIVLSFKDILFKF